MCHPNPAVQVHISGIRALAAAAMQHSAAQALDTVTSGQFWQFIRAVDRVVIRGWIKTYDTIFIYPYLVEMNGWTLMTIYDSKLVWASPGYQGFDTCCGQHLATSLLSCRVLLRSRMKQPLGFETTWGLSYRMKWPQHFWQEKNWAVWHNSLKTSENWQVHPCHLLIRFGRKGSEQPDKDGCCSAMANVNSCSAWSGAAVGMGKGMTTSCS